MRAEVSTALCSGDRELPRGAVLEGSVARATRVGLGLIHETSRLDLRFDTLRLPDGTKHAVAARLTGIENARERVDSLGGIHGPRSTASYSNRAAERIAFAVLKHPAAMAPLFVLEAGVLHFPDPEIELPPGTQLDLEFEAPEAAGGILPCPAPVPGFDEAERRSLTRFVEALPYWSFSRHQPQPMDLVNLVFVGSREDLENAFRAAGWTGSAPNSVRAGVNAVRAIAQDSPFAKAPMRTLLLDGIEPELRLQKSLNTFEKRDHLRIWRRGEDEQGRTVWASAATRDVAATFSLRPFGFTHQIENDVDRERDAVVADLQGTGCVAATGYAFRPEPPRAPGEPYRRGIITDAGVAAVLLEPCSPPAPVTAAAPVRVGWLVRSIRRVTLTARNRLLRDNIVWRSADGVRLGVQTLRAWNRQRKDELQARQMAAAFAASLHVR